MLITTTNDVPGFKVVRVIGALSATHYESLNFVTDWFAGFREFFGGRMGSLTNAHEAAVSGAVTKLRTRAEAAGANAIIGLRTNMAVDGGGRKVAGAQAYGTAVTIQTE